MAPTGLHKFALQLQQVLNEPWDFTNPENYIHLDQVGEVTRDSLNQDTGLPGVDPLVDAFNLIMEQAQNLYAENIVLGINEIFKAYLTKISESNQKKISLRVMDCMKMLFQFIMGDSFPYTEKLWEDMCFMTKPVGLFLIKEGYFEACSIFFESAAFLGKQASRKGLSTGILQHSFRIAELACRNSSCPDLVPTLQNLRRNLEN